MFQTFRSTGVYRNWPDSRVSEFESLFRALLQPDPRRRVSAAEASRHAFFIGLQNAPRRHDDVSGQSSPANVATSRTSSVSPEMTAQEEVAAHVEAGWTDAPAFFSGLVCRLKRLSEHSLSQIPVVVPALLKYLSMAKAGTSKGKGKVNSRTAGNDKGKGKALSSLNGKGKGSSPPRCGKGKGKGKSAAPIAKGKGKGKFAWSFSGK